MSTKTNKLLEAALSYAEQDWQVIPLHSPTNKGCSCKKSDCKSIGKHPRTKNGYKNATTDSSVIRKWWKKWPEANVGIVTGKSSSLVVLDIDRKHSGEDSLSELEQEHGIMPVSLETSTGGGGRHHFFTHPGGPVKGRTAIKPGLDLKADGGYIVAPPSLHATGMNYEWVIGSLPEDVSLPPCPTWLLQEMPHQSKSIVDPSSILEGVDEGQRDDQLFGYACLLRARAMTREEASVLVLEAASNCNPPFPEQEALSKIESAWKYSPKKAYVEAKKLERPQGYTAAELMATEFKEPSWIVQGMLPEGVALLCGKPKMGKSWAALNLAVAVALGRKALGEADVMRGDVIYLSLEDNFKRLKQRTKKVLQGGTAPSNLHLFTSWQKTNHGGIDHLEEMITQNLDTRLVVVDTLAKIRHRPGTHGNLHFDDYMALDGLKALADEYELAILVVHHLRKAGADDVLDLVSGTTGLTGAADTIFVLERGRGRAEAVLSITGRDIEEKEIALEFDKATCTWQLLGNADDYSRSSERQDIIDLLRDADEPLAPKEIAECLERKQTATRSLLSKMRKSGEVKKDSYGKYVSGN